MINSEESEECEVEAEVREEEKKVIDLRKEEALISFWNEHTIEWEKVSKTNFVYLVFSRKKKESAKKGRKRIMKIWLQRVRRFELENGGKKLQLQWRFKQMFKANWKGFKVSPDNQEQEGGEGGEKE